MIIAATRYGKVVSSGGGLPPYSSTGVGPITREDSETGNWEMAFLGDGTITFGRDVDVDVFLVGGGAKGNTDGNGWETAWSRGGSGGAGGECITQTGVHLTESTSYPVTIGGSGASSTGFGYTARSGYGSAGGAGAKAGSDSQDPTFTAADAAQGVDGVYAFGTADTLYGAGVKYGAGGGGGAASTTNAVRPHAAGGISGGGAGGQNVDGLRNGKDGTANTGGGGGGPAYVSSYNPQPAGNGGSGIVIIRNARSSS